MAAWPHRHLWFAHHLHLRGHPLKSRVWHLRRRCGCTLLPEHLLRTLRSLLRRSTRGVRVRSCLP
eukprot:1771774-Pyramimonas_sp.AAC.1